MTITLIDDRGTNYNLTSWHGTANLWTLLDANVCVLILDICLRDGPIALLQANFNLSEANIDSSGLLDKIHSKILKLGFNQICHSTFLQLCPGYSNQAHAALDHIWQSTQGPNGQQVTLTVTKFYQRLMNAS
jgi:hypothetical protein